MMPGSRYARTVMIIVAIVVILGLLASYSLSPVGP